MSSVPNGGSNIFIASGASGNWWVERSSSGWPGNSVYQCQPLNTSASLKFDQGTVELQSGGTYRFWVNIKNNGPNSTFFNLQNAWV